MIQVLSGSVHSSHVPIVLVDDVGLWDLHIILGCPGVAGGSRHGLVTQAGTDQSNSRVVIPPGDNLRLVLEHNGLMVSPLILLELVNGGEGGACS